MVRLVQVFADLVLSTGQHGSTSREQTFALLAPCDDSEQPYAFEVDEGGPLLEYLVEPYQVLRVSQLGVSHWGWWTNVGKRYLLGIIVGRRH